jgi:hypothetical protein
MVTMGRAFLLIMMLTISLLIPFQSAHANGEKEKKDVLQTLKDAFQAQVSLSEEERTLEEVDQILTPYFTRSYISFFLDENLVEMDGKYFTLGTDFALYYIPFFTYSTETKVYVENNEANVYEFFSSDREGPVSYENQYQGVKLIKIGGEWKVSDYFFDFHPEKIINKQNISRITKEVKGVPQIGEGTSNPRLFFNMSLNPLEAFLQYGVIMASSIDHNKQNE